ncbi:NAD-dependent nucleoside-diphosphate-sugar epimerase protein [Rhizobium sp. NXC14]|nr:NAD-dependent nucleoside-diphosphate-sugar epimerase protein [Rhizobium sp. NXC14]
MLTSNLRHHQPASLSSYAHAAPQRLRPCSAPPSERVPKPYPHALCHPAPELVFRQLPHLLETRHRPLQIALPAAEGKSSFIDARDIAASGVAALTSSSFDGKAFNLTGPVALSYAEAAAILSEAIGKPVTYNAVSDEAFIEMLTGAGVPAGYASFLASIFYPVPQNWTAALTGDVETLTAKAPALTEVLRGRLCRRAESIVAE